MKKIVRLKIDIKNEWPKIYFVLCTFCSKYNIFTHVGFAMSCPSFLCNIFFFSPKLSLFSRLYNCFTLLFNIWLFSYTILNNFYCFSIFLILLYDILFILLFSIFFVFLFNILFVLIFYTFFIFLFTRPFNIDEAPLWLHQLFNPLFIPFQFPFIFCH